MDDAKIEGPDEDKEGFKFLLIDVAVRTRINMWKKEGHEREETRRGSSPRRNPEKVEHSHVLRTAKRKAANLRREHPMVSSNNDILQYFIRSDMDMKVLLRDSDVRGALFYILNNSPKTEITWMPF